MARLASPVTISPASMRMMLAPRMAQTHTKRARLVRATGEPTESPVSTPPTPVSEPTPVPTLPPPTPANPTLTEAMAFNAAPELINGRLAQLGFLAAVMAELVSQESITQQIGDAWLPISLTVVLISAASLIPVLKGAKREAFGPLTPEAEVVNSRVAMIGFAALLGIEAFKGSALF